MAGPNEIAARINGVVYDFGSYAITIDDERYEGILSATYSQKRERAMPRQQSGSRLPLGKTPGVVLTEECKIKMYAQTWADMRLNLATRAGGLSYGDRIFDISMVATHPRLPPLNDLLGMCTIASEGGGGEGGENVDGLTVEIGVHFGLLLRDGLTLFQSLL